MTDKTNIIRTSFPDDRQLQDMLELTELCRNRDHTHTSCPLDPEESACHYLYYGSTHAAGQRPALLGICSIVPYDEVTFECIAFTHPDFRRQGIFSELISHAMEKVSDFDLLFPVSEHCPDALNTLEAIGAEPESEELQMELDLGRMRHSGVAPAADCRFRLSSDTDSQSSLTVWNLYAGSDSETRLGSCQTSDVGNHCICLHHVEVPSSLRRKGYGTILMKLLIRHLLQSDISRILLQVSGGNLPALTLYKKQGFRVTETLSYYLY